MHIAPHPLDFDWRFEEATVHRICAMLSPGKTVLALGAPSVARRLEQLGCDVMLIDRQPKLGVSRHFVAEIELLVNPVASGYDVAIVDPPWYPDSLVHWATYAANCVRVGGTVLTSAWPAWARPTAEHQLNKVIATMSDWATVRRVPFDPTYNPPRFEQLAIEAGGQGPLSVSPRRGVLLELSVLRKPPQLSPLARPEVWQRFVIDDYQLALRLCGPETACPSIVPHPKAVGWQWPYVSARAPGRSEIDLWSSEGEVARVFSATTVAELVRRAISSERHDAFERALKQLPDLLSWKIPRPPYRSLIEWQHQQ
jgi:hypothetical protein